MKKVIQLVLALALCVPVVVKAGDPMFSKSVIRAVDLREKQNVSWFSKNREITRFLMEAALRGDIKVYSSDSLNTTLTIAEIQYRFASPDAKNIPTDTLELESLYGEDWKQIANGLKNSRWEAKDIYQMEIRENVEFSKDRSQLQYKPKALTFFIPADHPANLKGIQEHLMSFDYNDVYRVLGENPNAIWYNVVNPKEHKNMAQAFELRLFSSYLVKVANPSDAYLVDIYGNDQQKGIMASQWAAAELMEFEHHLWEY